MMIFVKRELRASSVSTCSRLQCPQLMMFQWNAEKRIRPLVWGHWLKINFGAQPLKKIEALYNSESGAPSAVFVDHRGFI